MKDIYTLKIVLVERKKTGKWLAEQLGKDPSTGSKWWSNASQPSLEILGKIAETLRVDRREFIHHLAPSGLFEQSHTLEMEIKKQLASIGYKI